MKIFFRSAKAISTDRLQALALERYIRLDSLSDAAGQEVLTLTASSGDHPQYYHIYKTSRFGQRSLDSIDAVQMTLKSEDGFTSAVIEWNGLGHYILLPVVGVAAMAAVVQQIIVGKALAYSAGQWVTIVIFLGLFLALPLASTIRWINNCRIEIRMLKELWAEATNGT